MTRFRRRIAAVRRHDEDGFTIAEMIVASFVSMLVISGVGAALIATVNTTQQTSDRLNATNAGDLAINSMSRVLRAAVAPSQLNDVADTEAAFITGTPTSVAFYSDLRNDGDTVGPSRVTLSLSSSGVLTESIQQPDKGRAAGSFNYTWCTPGPGCVVPTTTLARGVVQPGGTVASLFTYYDDDGATIATPLTGDMLSTVDSIDLSLTLHVGSGHAKAVADSQYVLRVSLPNQDSVLNEQGN